MKWTSRVVVSVGIDRVVVGVGVGVGVSVVVGVVVSVDPLQPVALHPNASQSQPSLCHQAHSPLRFPLPMPLSEPSNTDFPLSPVPALNMFYPIPCPPILPGASMALPLSLGCSPFTPLPFPAFSLSLNETTNRKKASLRRHVCPTCMKKFTRKSNLVAHMR